MPERDPDTAAVELELSLLFRGARAVAARFAATIHPDLTAGEYFALAAVADMGTPRSTDLVPRLGLDKSTVSRQVAALRDLGLVQVRADDADGRARVVALTDEGRRRFEAARRARHRQFRAYLQTWEQDELDRLGTLLHRLNTDLDPP